MYETLQKSLTDDEITSLARITAILSSRVISSKNEKFAEKVYKLLSKLWKSKPVIFEKTFEHLVNADNFQVSFWLEAKAVFKIFS